jgi:hypothetical protein
MSQIFKPYANTIARASLVLGISAPLVIGVSLAALSRSPFNTKVQVPLNQPVPFSHQHHAWELGIDCRYCHTTVERSSYAGIPPTETCMSCHSQIWTNSPLLEPVRTSYETGQPLHWNLVNKTPEFVYFNHSIHIARGINCNNCHGPVQDMQITYKGNQFQMAWCLECHRAPERYMRNIPGHEHRTPRQQVFDYYWIQQEHSTEVDGVTRDIIAGQFKGSDNPVHKAEGRELINKLGVKVQQLADCWICHR